jgi:hypothetical protein
MSTRIIKINRGDSFEFKMAINEKNKCFEKHLLAVNEAVYFALLYPHQRFEDAILIKGYTLEDQDVETGELKIKIEPNDTRTLTPGVYYYTVKLQRGGTLEAIHDFDKPEEVRTIIERTKFVINE